MLNCFLFMRGQDKAISLASVATALHGFDGGRRLGVSVLARGARRLALITAKTNPESATAIGIAPIFTSFVQNSIASVSRRRFLRTCFKSLLTSTRLF